jgi:glucoside 3-dehydrogenase (cytochrome c) hitch-hiker subunit
MNRREFLQCAAILASGTGMSQAGFSMTAEQHQFMLAAPNFIEKEVNYFTASQRTLVAAMAETIIPRTDTPGAIDAGVPRFIELMVARWLNDEEKTIFEAGLHSMETDIPKKYGKPFDELDSAQKLAILEELEASASDSSWYELGNVLRGFESDAPFICQMKELTVWGFFTSELGSKEVLRYNPMPMRFDGNFPLSTEESTWWTNR